MRWAEFVRGTDGAGEGSDTAPVPCGKLEPPFRPARVAGAGPWVALVLAAAVVVLAAGAGYDDARLLAPVDEPVQRFMQDISSGPLTRLVLWWTALGHQNLILPVTALLAALSWHRCRPIVWLLLGATVMRILIHLVLKDGLARSRPPEEDAFASAVGNSFPSGHVISAVLIWGLVPLVVTLYTDRRRWWLVATVAAATVMATSTVSRIYLGVHWFTDVVAGLFVAWALLIVFDVLLLRMTVGAGARQARPGGEPGEHAGVSR